MTNVGELMNKGRPLSVGPSTTVAEAATMMGERRVGSALVMEGDALLGIFTERDIVKALGAHFDAAKHQVSEWMTSNPTTVPPDAPARDALKTMLDGGFRHLPVLDGEKVIGVVSMRDLSRLESEA
jgi:CBS domain-containing protein